MRNYPIGIQTFSEIIEGKFVYIDKTEIIHKLILSGKYYFLSRPRRFGKSLLLSTIKDIFSGRKELFKGLWIEDNWNWEKKHPVIHLRFGRMDYQSKGLYKALRDEMDTLAQELQVSLTSDSLKDKFKELIQKVSTNEKVVILIDEYDKPTVDYLDEPEKVNENRNVFKSFYSVLKDADEYIRFLILTGVSRFSKVSIFSDLNNLEDISVGSNFNNLVGITQQELEYNFAPEIAALQKEHPAILNELKTWYNGYSWGGKDTLYNPFSLLSFMKQKEFRNFWFATGSPTWLVKLLKDKGEYRFENIRAGEIALGNFYIDNPVPASLLFQTGYLTIKEYDTGSQMYTLDYPNQEVRASLLDNLLSAYRDVFPADSLAITSDLKDALISKDIPQIIKELNSVIGSIAYDHWKADTESIFHIITYLTFKSVGVHVSTEVQGSKGRCDVLVKTSHYIYAIELKLDKSAKAALNQILRNKYLQPYEADKRTKIALGINFSSAKRAVVGHLVKEL